MLERVESKLGAGGLACPPTDDAPGKHVDDERDVEHAHPSLDVREVAHPQPAWPVGDQATVDLVEWARCGFVAYRRADRLAADDATETNCSH